MSEESNQPTTSRRKFIAGAAIVGAVATLEGSSAIGYFSHQYEPRKPPKSKGVVVTDMEVCSGCRSCQAACTVFNDGECQPDLARIQVLKDYFKGDYLPNQCTQCLWPGCLYSCPTGALQVDTGTEGGVSQLEVRLSSLLSGKLTPETTPGTNARVVNERECIGCQQCVEGCAKIFDVSRVRFNSKKQVVTKCHLCGGEPQCVRFCPVGAVLFASADEGLSIGYDGQGNIIWIPPEAKPKYEHELRGILW
ncbi:MAG: 4Fe-4S dicluster domain-containing protein [Nitrososphaerales archaeon]